VSGPAAFIVEATDTVQGPEATLSRPWGALNSARSKLNLAQIVEKRANDLYAGKARAAQGLAAVPERLTTAQNDVRSAETALEAVHNRLRILAARKNRSRHFRETRQISADTPINSPIAGTVVQRKVGPGQYISTGASDPVFVIGDLLDGVADGLCA